MESKVVRIEGSPDVDPRINVGLFGGVNSFSKPVSAIQGSISDMVAKDASPDEPPSEEMAKKMIIEELKAHARDHIVSGKIDEAIKCFDEIIELDPVDGGIYKGVMISLLLPERYMDAITAVGRAIVVSRDKSCIYLLDNILERGNMHVFREAQSEPELVTLDQLIKELEFYLSLDGNSMHQRRHAGRLYQVLKKYLESDTGKSLK